MNAHTPGPWNVGSDGFTVVQPHPSYPKSTVGYVIAKTDHEKVDGQPTDRAKANARLIAAAPELLAAVKALMDTTHQCGVDCDMGKTCPIGDQARAAIAKAEGRAA